MGLSRVRNRAGGAFAPLALAVLAGCGGGSAASAPRPSPGLPPVIVREIPPDPIPTMDPVCDEDFTADEARPVSATTIGHYYIENGGLVYLVLLRGSPAWYGDLKDWQVSPPPVGQNVRTAEIAGFRYALDLDIGERVLQVRDNEVDLQKTNVVFVDRVANDLIVVGGELMNLCWSSRPDAVGQVLSRSPAAARFVRGTAAAPRRAVPPARRSRR